MARFTTGDLATKIEAEVTKVVEGERWRLWLDAQARFHTYSACNVMLIWSQRPTATLVAGYNTWQKMGRQVQAGEHGLAIYVPFHHRRREKDDETGEEAERQWTTFGVGYVYDVSQTEGDPLPKPTVEVAGDALAEQVTRLTDALGKQAVVVTFPAEVSGGPLGQTTWHKDGTVEVQVMTGRNADALFRTLTHEAAHVLLQHKERGNGRAELEAESVAYATCAALGVDAGGYSFPYLATWANGDPKRARLQVSESMDAIAKTVKTILGWLEPAQVKQPVEVDA